MQNKRLLKTTLITLASFLFIGAILFAVDFTTQAPLGANSLMIEKTLTKEIKDGYTKYTPPPAIKNNKGFILYAGAKVHAQSYNYIAHFLTAHGYTVFYSDFFLNYAFFNIQLADKIIAENNDMTDFAISGHSLGGAMMGKFLNQSNTDKITHVIFLASYSVDDIVSLKQPVLSLSATLDGNTTPQKIQENAHHLPATTQFIAIEGGNHRQFADYQNQKGDLEATISQDAQHTAILKAIYTFLQT